MTWRDRFLYIVIGIALSPIVYVIWKAGIYFIAGVAVVVCGPGATP